MIIVYTGAGKGKTCACVGQALRAAGSGLKVAFGQFIKQANVAGEQKILAELFGGNFLAGGLGFCFPGLDSEPHRAKAAELMAWASEVECDMLVLDEAVYALKYGLINLHDLLALAKDARGKKRHLVLSGRDAPTELKGAADIVTEMEEVRHPFKLGVAATRGIEF